MLAQLMVELSLELMAEVIDCGEKLHAWAQRKAEEEGEEDEDEMFPTGFTWVAVVRIPRPRLYLVMWTAVCA